MSTDSPVPNEFREELRREFALEALENCYVYGEYVLFQDRATDPAYWVWAIPDAERRVLDSDVGGIQEEQTTRDWFVPYQEACPCGQPGCWCENKKWFPPLGEPSSNSTITNSETEYSMDSFDRDAIGSAYTLHMSSQKARRTNP